MCVSRQKTEHGEIIRICPDQHCNLELFINYLISIGIRCHSLVQWCYYCCQILHMFFHLCLLFRNIDGENVCQLNQLQMTYKESYLLKDGLFINAYSGEAKRKLKKSHPSWRHAPIHVPVFLPADPAVEQVPDSSPPPQKKKGWERKGGNKEEMGTALTK